MTPHKNTGVSPGTSTGLEFPATRRSPCMYDDFFLEF